MSSLDGIGIISYNGYTFAGPRVKTDLEIHAVPDPANRTIKTWEYRLTVEAYITADTLGKSGAASPDSEYVPGLTGEECLSANIDSIRGALGANGGALIYTGQGFGDQFEVNTGTTGGHNGNVPAYRDVNYGPKVSIIRCRPIAPAMCWEIVWTCTFTLPVCRNFLASGVILAFSYTSQYGIDRNGLTTRTISGSWEISQCYPVTGAAGNRRNILKSPDEHRKTKLPIPIPTDFERIRQEYHISADRRVENFIIVDREIESNNHLPPGIVEADMRVRCQLSGQGPGWCNMQLTIMATFEYIKTVPPGIALEKMLLISRDRIAEARRNAKSVLLVAAEVDEHVFRNRVDFNWTFMVLLNPDQMKDWMKAGALFKPVDATWQNWAASMVAGGPWNPHGIARLEDDPQGDYIVDSCAGGFTPDLSKVSKIVPRPGAGDNQVTSISDTCRKDYITWDGRITYGDKNMTSIHIPISSGKDTPDNGTSGMVARDDSVAHPSIPQVPSLNADDGTIIQVLRDTRRMRLRIHGHAVRVADLAAIPDVDKITNGMVDKKYIVKKRSDIDHVQIGVWGGCAIWASRWDIEYEVTFPLTSNIQMYEPKKSDMTDPGSRVVSPNQTTLTMY